MRLTTVIIFAVIGLIVCAPAVLKKQQDAPNSNWQAISNQATAGNNWNGSSQDSAIFSSATPDKKKPGLLARIFGSVEETPGEMTPGSGSSPFQFAASPASGNVPGMTTGAATFTEPVYYAFASFNEFLRFDISPAWLKSRWPRVSHVPGENQLSGMRVALVSGPRPADIQGALTYYFDSRQRVQRIAFKGWTGDGGEIARFFQQLGFERQRSKGAGLFTKSVWGKLQGALRLDHPVVSTNALPNQQLMVMFEWVNPESSLRLSQQTTSILNAIESR